MIEGCAIRPNFSLVTSFDANSPRLPHCGDGSSIELTWAVGKISDRRLRCRVSEEHLICSEQTLSCHQILVIHIVKCSWGYRIHVVCYAGIHILGQADISCLA